MVISTTSPSILFREKYSYTLCPISKTERDENFQASGIQDGFEDEFDDAIENALEDRLKGASQDSEIIGSLSQNLRENLNELNRSWDWEESGEEMRDKALSDKSAAYRFCECYIQSRLRSKLKTKISSG